ANAELDNSSTGGNAKTNVLSSCPAVVRSTALIVNVPLARKLVMPSRKFVGAGALPAPSRVRIVSHVESCQVPASPAVETGNGSVKVFGDKTVTTRLPSMAGVE